MTEIFDADGRNLVPGLYERLMTGELHDLLIGQTGIEFDDRPVADADVPHVVARYVAQRLESALSSRSAPDRVVLANAVLGALGERLPAAGLTTVGEGKKTAPQVLRELRRPGTPLMDRPSTPLSEVALLTNAAQDPQLSSELRLEMRSADTVDLLCSFVKLSGMRVLAKSFEDLSHRGIRLRVLTTTYIGATERKALDDLVLKYGTQVKISYNAKSTRLHAKAWLFRRHSGFHTGYVGSSNLSSDALLDGLEWNVRISQIVTPSLMEKFEATFDSYWNSAEFEDYLPARDADRLDRSLAENSGRGTVSSAGINWAFVDVRPYPHQQEVLDDLRAAREVQDHHQNLLVAATGTGKTVIAALDYRRLEETLGRRPRLLFVAHSEQILNQSRGTYRQVLRDATFGELMVGGYQPVQKNHVFASVQSISRAEQIERWDPKHFDVIVIDEFHHAQAPTYRRLMEHFDPQEMVGLTGTPERADGVNVAQQFFQGRVASSLRLWDALEADLLVPFHYFGINDDTDLRRVAFTRGEYDRGELSRVYTGDHQRVRLILAALEDKVADVRTMRALGFCVTVQHAHFMAEQFVQAGIPAVALTGDSTEGQRKDALGSLRAGDLACIFAVDLFNEGLDIPAVDTLLMLRPTQSATIFLQQLGRGLRRSEGKAVLTVLDFVGMQNQRFRFDLKLRAMTGLSRQQLKRDVERGFPFLPSGSQIVLDETVQQEVVQNIRSQLNLSAKELVSDIAQHLPEMVNPQDYALTSYLERADRSVADIYGKSVTRSYDGTPIPSTWTTFKLKAFPELSTAALEDENDVLRRVRALTHVDDHDRIVGYRQVLARDNHGSEARGNPYARMLYFAFWPSGTAEDLPSELNRLARSTFVRQEILQLLDQKERDLHAAVYPLPGTLATTGLQTHAHYSRDELLAALGVGTTESGTPRSKREGVVYLPQLNTDALLITLKKSEADYSPTTLYRDYAINETHFHWESQNSTSPLTPTGQRYQHHEEQGSSVLLFVRNSAQGDIGTEPYLCLGTARYISHQGSKPMQIIWELDRPMPAEMLIAARAVA